MPEVRGGWGVPEVRGTWGNLFRWHFLFCHDCGSYDKMIHIYQSLWNCTLQWAHFIVCKLYVMLIIQALGCLSGIDKLMNITTVGCDGLKLGEATVI